MSVGFGAPPTGLVGWLNFAGIEALPGQDPALGPNAYFDATASAPTTGKVALSLDDSGRRVVVFDYTATYTKALFHVSLRSEVTREGVTWSEYAAKVEAPMALTHPLEYACSIHAVHDSTVREFRRAV